MKSAVKWGPRKIIPDYHRYSAIAIEFNEKHRLIIKLCKSCLGKPACLLCNCLGGLGTYSGLCNYG